MFIDVFTNLCDFIRNLWTHLFILPLGDSGLSVGAFLLGVFLMQVLCSLINWLLWKD